MNEKPLILIVDDDRMNRKLLSGFISAQEMDTLEAGNGLEALVLLEDVTPSLIVSDIEMPKMDGLRFLKELARRKIDVPVIIMTGFGSIEYAVEAMKNGAADFLSKPLDMPYVLKVMTRVMQRSAMEYRIREQQRQLDDDLHHAALFQQRLLPNEIDTPHLALHYRYQPMIQIGGDYLTVHKYSDSRIAVALYDVSGHGVTAAFVAHLAHNQLQMRLAEHRPPSNVIDLVNRYIEKTVRETTMFITMIVAIIDAEEKTLSVCNAGHPDILLWRNRDSSLESISSNVPIVGVIEKLLKGDNDESHVELSSGDKIILYTDGFPEARNSEGTILEHKGFLEMVQQTAGQPSPELIASLFRQVKNYEGENQEDDMTMVVVTVK